jgi:hypothetical protein
MKRYSMGLFQGAPAMFEQPDGDYVKWSNTEGAEMIDGLTKALQIVEAEIARAETLLNVEDGGQPVFDRAMTEAGIVAHRGRCYP